MFVKEVYIVLQLDNKPTIGLEISLLFDYRHDDRH